MTNQPSMDRRRFAALAASFLAAPASRALAQQVPEFWNYLGGSGEIEAVRALIEVANAQNPSTPITNRTIPGSTAGLRQQLQTALLGGAPPAVSQFNTGYELREAALSGRLLKINEAWDAIQGDKVFSDGLRRIVSVGADHYAVPLSASVLGNCFYSKAIFDRLGLKPPTGWDEFGEVCAKVKAAGLTPLGASSPQSFLLYQWYGPMLTVLGVDGYWAFTRGEVAFNGPELKKSFALFKERVASNFSRAWGGSKWSDGLDQMMRGETAMYIIGDWGSGYMEQRGWKGGVDYDFFPSPGLEKVTIFQTDVIVAYKGAQENTGLNFMRSAASPQGQAAFNRYKGSLAVSSAAPTDFYSAVGKREFEKMTRGGDYVALPNPYFLIPTGFHLEFATAVERFASTLDEPGFHAALDGLDAKRKALKDAGKFITW